VPCYVSFGKDGVAFSSLWRKHVDDDKSVALYQHVPSVGTTGSALVSEDEDTGNSNPKNGRHS